MNFLKKQLLFWAFLTIVTSSFAQIDSIFKNCPEIKGDYFSETKPGLVPEVFAPFLLNSKIHHLHCAPAFTPDGKEMFFSVYVNNVHPQRIFHTVKIGEIWQKPKLASFSGIYQDGGPVISLDGSTLYFYSKRPKKTENEASEESRIWFVKKKEGVWGNPKLLDFPSELGIAFYPNHCASDGLFYFNIKVKERDSDVFSCKIINDKPIEIKRLKEPINLAGIIEGGAMTDPQNRILIFYTYNRSGNKKRGFYYCNKMDEGSWSEPKLIDKFEILKESRFAGFTPDGKYFFFSSYKEGYEQIYWIPSTQVFDELK